MSTLQSSTSRVVVPWSKNDGALLRAVEKQKILKVEKLITKKGVDPSKLSPIINNTAIHRSVEIGFFDVFSLLLSHVTNINCLNGEGKTLLHTACMLGRDGVVGALLKNSSFNLAALDCDGLTALHLACSLGHLGCVRLLCSKIDPNFVDKNGWTPLFYSAARGSASVCRLLLDSGADVNAKDSARRTPLMTSVGHKATFEFLLSRGADLTATDNAGHTAESYAVRGNCQETLKFLADKKNGQLTGLRRTHSDSRSAAEPPAGENDVIYSRAPGNKQPAETSEEVQNAQHDDEVENSEGNEEHDRASNTSSSSSSTIHSEAQEGNDDPEQRRVSASSSSSSTPVNQDIRETEPNSGHGRGSNSGRGSRHWSEAESTSRNNPIEDDKNEEFNPTKLDKSISTTLRDLNKWKSLDFTNEISRKSLIDYRQLDTDSESEKFRDSFRKINSEKRQSLQTDYPNHPISDELKRELNRMKVSYDTQLQKSGSKQSISSAEYMSTCATKSSQESVKIDQNKETTAKSNNIDYIFDLKHENKHLQQRLREVELKYEEADDKIRKLERKQSILENKSSRRSSRLSSTASSQIDDNVATSFFTIKHLAKRIEQLEMENQRLRDQRSSESDVSSRRHSARNIDFGSRGWGETYDKEFIPESKLHLCDRCHSRKGRQKNGRRKSDAEKRNARKCNRRNVEENDASSTSSSSDSFRKPDSRRRYPRNEDRSEMRQENRTNSRKGSQQSEAQEHKYNNRNHSDLAAMEGEHVHASVCLLADPEFELGQTHTYKSKSNSSSHDNLAKCNLVHNQPRWNLEDTVMQQRSDKSVSVHSAQNSGRDSPFAIDENLLNDKNAIDNESNDHVGRPFTMQNFAKYGTEHSSITANGSQDTKPELISTGVNTDKHQEDNAESDSVLDTYDSKYVKEVEEELSKLRQQLLLQELTSEKQEEKQDTINDDRLRNERIRDDEIKSAINVDKKLHLSNDYTANEAELQSESKATVFHTSESNQTAKLKIESLHNDNLLLTGRVVSLSQLLDKLKRDFEEERQNLQERIREVELENIQLQLEKRKRHLEIDQLKADVASLQLSKLDFESQLDNLLFHTEQLQNEKFQYQLQISQLKHDFRKLISDKEMFDSIMKTLNSEMGEITKENSKYQIELRRLRDDILQLRSEMDRVDDFDYPNTLSQMHEAEQSSFPLLERVDSDSLEELNKLIQTFESDTCSKALDSVDAHDSHAILIEDESKREEARRLIDVDDSLLIVSSDKGEAFNANSESIADAEEDEQLDAQANNNNGDGNVIQSETTSTLETQPSQPDTVEDNPDKQKVPRLTIQTNANDHSTLVNSHSAVRYETDLGFENDQMMSARFEGKSRTDFDLTVSLDSTLDSGVLSWQPSPDSLKSARLLQESEKERFEKELSSLRQQNSSLRIAIQQRDNELRKLRGGVTSASEEKQLENSNVSLVDNNEKSPRQDKELFAELTQRELLNDDKLQCTQLPRQLRFDYFNSDLQKALCKLESNSKFTEFKFKLPNQQNNPSFYEDQICSDDPAVPAVESDCMTLERLSERSRLLVSPQAADCLGDDLESNEKIQKPFSAADNPNGSNSQAAQTSEGNEPSPEASSANSASEQFQHKPKGTEFEEREVRYNQIIDAYRSHLLAAIHGCLDDEVKENLVRIVQLSLIR